MTRIPKKYILDTNVPITANRVFDQDLTDDEKPCVNACVEAVSLVTTNKTILVIDSDGHIYSEYLNNLSQKGQPGLRDGFLKWIHDNQWDPSKTDRVPITPTENSFLEFPNHDGLKNFDPSDRKFVATANAHPEKPPILEATDSKWWGWKEALFEVGISVNFLCPDYIQSKYQK